MMKRFISSVLVLGVCLTPLTVPAIVQPSWGQSQDSQVEKVRQLMQQAEQHERQGQAREVIERWQQILDIARQLKERRAEAIALNHIGTVYNRISQPQSALKYLNQALPIRREVGDRKGEATTLNEIGLVYNSISQPQSALKYYNQALPIIRAVGDRRGEATTLNNIGLVYNNISQPQEALKYLNQALPISREVGDRALEATTLNNIGAVYNDISQPQEALKYYNQALLIINGEEISGIAYVFERAGAQAVMTSLWGVEDSATKELMVQFYQNINKGMSKNEALRQAKLSQISRHLFYWSPFILIGDGR